MYHEFSRDNELLFKMSENLLLEKMHFGQTLSSGNAPDWTAARVNKEHRSPGQQSAFGQASEADTPRQHLKIHGTRG